MFQLSLVAFKFCGGLNHENVHLKERTQNVTFADLITLVSSHDLCAQLSQLVGSLCTNQPSIQLMH